LIYGIVPKMVAPEGGNVWLPEMAGFVSTGKRKRKGNKGRLWMRKKGPGRRGGSGGQKARELCAQIKERGRKRKERKGKSCARFLKMASRKQFFLVDRGSEEGVRILGGEATCLKSQNLKERKAGWKERNRVEIISQLKSQKICRDV